MKKFKVGIIGCGGIATNKHMPSIKELGRADMVAFCDIDIDKAKKQKKALAQPMLPCLKIIKSCSKWIWTLFMSAHPTEAIPSSQ